MSCAQSVLSVIFSSLDFSRRVSVTPQFDRNRTVHTVAVRNSVPNSKTFLMTEYRLRSYVLREITMVG